MASARDPKLIAENVAFADAGEIPNGRIISFLLHASTESGEADQVYRQVIPIEGKLAARAPSDAPGPSPLMAAAAGSSDPATARLLAAPSSHASIGGAYLGGAGSRRNTDRGGAAAPGAGSDAGLDGLAMSAAARAERFRGPAWVSWRTGS